MNLTNILVVIVEPLICGLPVEVAGVDVHYAPYGAAQPTRWFSWAGGRAFASLNSSLRSALRPSYAWVLFRVRFARVYGVGPLVFSTTYRPVARIGVFTTFYRWGHYGCVRR